MKKIFILGLLLSTTLFLSGQRLEHIINPIETGRILQSLSHDSMKGRRVYSAGIDKSAELIQEEFRKMGMRTFDANDRFVQSFMMLRPKFVNASALVDGHPLAESNIVIITGERSLRFDNSSDYEEEQIKAGNNLFAEASRFVHPRKNTLVFVDESYAGEFAGLAAFSRIIPRTHKNLVFLLGKPQKDYKVEANHEISEEKLANVIAVLPGRSKKDEWVIFSAHYDHIGVGPQLNGDSIYNGANDNASGTTAVLMLAKYFREVRNNERTLVFVAFTAEEVGGLGSQYFSRQVDPEKIVAMINIEMIGTESKWGKHSAFITGFEKSDLGTILQRNLKGTQFNFYPDPYPDKRLFYRSDNATLARLGVPAHTISTAKMDNEPNYHKVTDEVNTLDIQNLTSIIRAIAQSTTSIVEGKDTPSRIDKTIKAKEKDY